MRDELRCPSCGIKQMRFRIKTNDYVCNKCGEIVEKIVEDKE